FLARRGGGESLRVRVEMAESQSSSGQGLKESGVARDGGRRSGGHGTHRTAGKACAPHPDAKPPPLSRRPRNLPVGGGAASRRGRWRPSGGGWRGSGAIAVAQGPPGRVLPVSPASCWTSASSDRSARKACPPPVTTSSGTGASDASHPGGS